MPICSICRKPITPVTEGVYYCANCNRSLVERPSGETFYSGADWVEKALGVKVSALGRSVADLLGELFRGIYNMNQKHLRETAWDKEDIIQVHVAFADWSTYDFDNLTRLVFLAHHRALRVEMRPMAKSHMRLRFSQRQRLDRAFYEYHPGLQEAVNLFMQDVHLSEHSDCYPIFPATQQAE